MIYAVTMLLIAVTLLVLSLPWLRPGTIEQPAVTVRQKKISKPASDLEEDLEKEVMRLRQARRQATGTCRECGAHYPKEGRFCPQCGAKLSQ